MPGMTLKIARESPEHERLKTRLSGLIRMGETALSDRGEAWEDAERAVNAYVPETADDAKRARSRDAGSPTYTTIMIPYSYAQLMTSLTYWTTVFLSRDPIHQYSGRHGESENQTQAMEALIAYQTQISGNLPVYYLWLLDAGKYGLGVVGTYWDVETKYYSMLVEEQGQPVYVTNEIIGYKGNRTYNVSPWDFIPDPRVTVRRFQSGEFLAVYREISWQEVLRKKVQRYYMNIEHIRTTPTRQGGRGETSGWLERPRSINLETGEHNTRHPAWIGVYEVYVTLVPREWRLGNMEMPEIWVFTITADLATIIGAQPLGAIHCRYPFDVLEMEPETYGMWSRGIPDIMSDIQQTMDWLVNTHFFNVRAIANGRYIADPSKVDLSQLERGDPGWIIPLRPEAWGTVTDVRQVFNQIQLTDPTAQHFTDFERMFQIGERVSGISDQLMGAVGSGRKTATEVRSAIGFGTNRLKMASEFMSASGFAPHSQMLVQNTQQYMDAPTTVRIVGDLLRNAGPKFLTVSPQDIGGFYDFVPVDGSLPVDRFAQATLWKDIMAQLLRFPELAQSYDWARIFSWVSNLAGLKNVDQFRIQVMPDEVLASEAGRGNVIPMRSGSGQPPPQANVASTPTTNVGQ